MKAAPVEHTSRAGFARSAGRSRLPWLALTLLVAAPAAWAQYKVVGPDGRVTYTDRPTSVDPGSRVSPVRPPSGRGGGADTAAGLPLVLQPVVLRFPVLLVTSTDCAPCDRGRQLLRLRGIPYTERSATTDADGDALQRLSGARTVPTLVVGKQALKGLLDSDWHQVLDLAGYPQASVLPGGWQPAPAMALAGGQDTGPTAAGTAGVRSPEPAAKALPSAPTDTNRGLRGPAAAVPARPDPAVPSIRF